MRRQTSEERLYERVDGDRCGEDSYLRVRGQRDMGTLVEAVWTGGSLHSDIQLLWILLESESPAVGKFYKGPTQLETAGQATADLIFKRPCPPRQLGASSFSEGRCTSQGLSPVDSFERVPPANRPPGQVSFPKARNAP